MDAIKDFIAAHIAEILTSIVLALVGFMFVQLRGLSRSLVLFAKELKVKAAKTPGRGDDLAAAILLAFAEALEAALAANLVPARGFVTVGLLCILGGLALAVMTVAG